MAEMLNPTNAGTDGGAAALNQTPSGTNPPAGGNQDPNGAQDPNGSQANSNNGEPQEVDLNNLKAGDVLSIGDADYTIDENGNLVDKDNNIYKQAGELKDYLASLTVDEPNTDLNMENVQNLMGITITDEKGNAVEFSNTPEGFKSYISSVVDLKVREAQQNAIDAYYASNPMIKQFADYVAVTGSPKGFGDIPDRSNIKLDKDNEEQLMSIIRMAAKEFNNPTVNTNYLNYLKANGSLYDEAKVQLKALVDKDKAYMDQINTLAEQRKQESIVRQQELNAKVEKIIASKQIAGYSIPDTFTKDVNGKKVTFTPAEFYKYVTKAVETDENGNQFTGYQRDLNKLSDDEILNRDMLDAWLLFTGGSYKDLIDTAVKEDNVRKLKLKAKEAPNSKPTINVKPSSTKGFVLKSY